MMKPYKQINSSNILNSLATVHYFCPDFWGKLYTKLTSRKIIQYQLEFIIEQEIKNR